jgi:hypothetical protein
MDKKEEELQGEEENRVTHTPEAGAGGAPAVHAVYFVKNPPPVCSQEEEEVD